MALQELQPLLKVGPLELIRRPVDELKAGDQIDRTTGGLVDSFMWATYPRVHLRVGRNDKVKVVLYEASGNYTRRYTLWGEDIKDDPVISKLVRHTR